MTDENGDVAERCDYQDFGWPEVYSDAGYWRPASAPGIQNPFLFNGRRWDSVAQQYDYRTRRLDPRAGRFTTRDIIGTWGDPYNDGNSSTYVGNNPWSWVDPFGLVRKRQDGVIVDNDGVVIGPLPWDDEETALPPFTPDHVAEVLKEIQIAIALEVATFGLAKAISGAVQAARAAKACNRAGHGAESAANGLRLNNSLASEAQMSEVGQIIAGVGAKKGFRGAPRIARTFGGRPEDWVKKSSSTYKTRDGVLFETHWLENIKTGQKVEFKTKFPGKI